MPHKTRIRVAYSDTDSHAVVYFANYLRFAERARTEFIREMTAKSLADFEKDNYAFPFVHVEIEYRSSARYDDLISVYTRLTRIGKTSLGFNFEIKRESEHLCTINAVCVCVGLDFKKRNLPKEIKGLSHLLQGSG